MPKFDQNIIAAAAFDGVANEINRKPNGPVLRAALVAQKAKILAFLNGGSPHPIPGHDNRWVKLVGEDGPTAKLTAFLYVGAEKNENLTGKIVCKQ